MLADEGVTAIDTSAAGLTVSKDEPEMLPIAALTVVEPTLCEVARPFDPEALLTAATAAELELQVTADVMFCVVLSVYVPVAVNCSVRPSATVGFVGVTAIEVSAAAVTVYPVDPDTAPDPLPSTAVTVVEPWAAAVARPCEPLALLMLAVAEEDELQVTCEVRSWVVLLV